MQLADGEYDIDLLALGPDVSQYDSAFAIRYGFIPDSMDQSSPLRLFQDDLVCILEAQLTDKLAKTGVRALPIIFEGVPQGQRRSSGNSGISGDSYFLAFDAKEGPMKVLLQRLSNTIRVSKSRNAAKWRAAITEWQDGAKNTTNTRPGDIEIPHITRQVATPPPIARPMKKLTPVAKAQKRPPTETPDGKNDIISVSDFEDLEHSPEIAFPIFELSKPKAPTTRKEKPKIAKPVKQKVQPPKPADIDMDDDFKDLEDQLQEVLNEQPKPLSFNPSDSDEDDPPFVGAPIIIKVSEDKPLRVSRIGHRTEGKKPMSMRDLYGGARNDGGNDMSSSEEE